MALLQKENILKTVSYFLMGVRNGITNVRQFGLLAFAVIGLVSFSIFYWFQEIEVEGWQGFKQAQIWEKLGFRKTAEDEVNQLSLPIPLIDVEIMPGQMQRHILRKPEGVCQLIEEQGFNTEGWKGSRIGWSGWECLADFELKVDGKIKASAFFSMRGNAPDRITTLRLKFNLPQPGNGRKAYANMLAERSLIPLFDYFRWTFPHDLREKIRDLSPIETIMDGVEVNLFEEYDSAQFVHLLLTMPKEELPFVVSDGKVRSIFVARKPEAKEQPKRLRPVGSRRQVVDFSKPLRRDEEGIIIPDDIDDDEFGNPSLPVVEPAGEGEIIEVDAIDSIEKDDEILERQVGKEKPKPVRQRL